MGAPVHRPAPGSWAGGQQLVAQGLAPTGRPGWSSGPGEPQLLPASLCLCLSDKMKKQLKTKRGLKSKNCIASTIPASTVESRLPLENGSKNTRVYDCVHACVQHASLHVCAAMRVYDSVLMCGTCESAHMRAEHVSLIVFTCVCSTWVYESEHVCGTCDLCTHMQNTQVCACVYRT